MAFCLKSCTAGVQRLKALIRNTAIWSRLTLLSGQYSFGVAEQPSVIPSLASFSIQAAAQ
jgi:hypothetical protein